MPTRAEVAVTLCPKTSQMQISPERWGWSS